MTSPGLTAQLLQPEQVPAAPRETSEGCLTCFVLDQTSTRLPRGAGQGRGPRVPTEVWNWVLLPPPPPPETPRAEPAPSFTAGAHGHGVQHCSSPEHSPSFTMVPAEGLRGQNDAGDTLGQEAARHTSAKPRYCRARFNSHVHAAETSPLPEASPR